MKNMCICLQTLIPVRIEPSETSEMLTQILFGELFNLREANEKWAKIITLNDNYEGWIDEKLLHTLSDKEFDTIQNSKKIIVDPCLTQITKQDKNENIPIVGGSTLYCTEKNEMNIGNCKFCFNENEINLTQNIDNIARQYINAPYLWGGKSYLGIDCSGLMQVVFKSQNIYLPRDASEQAKFGIDISFVHEAKTGDLAFFDNSEGQIIHVGMFLDNKTIIHASGWVRIDPIDHQGIYKPEDKKYSHKLRIIKRIMD